MEEKIFFNGKFGKICGVLHRVENSKEIVIVIHGFSSSKDTGAVNISQELNKVGVDALRIDLDNQGESELDFKTGASVPNYIKQVEAAIDYCKKIGYNRISLVGGSYGGTVAFAVAVVRPEIKRLLLRAPVVDYKEHALFEFGEKKLLEFKKQGRVPYFNKHGEKLFVTFDYIEKAYPYSMYKLAKKVKIPTLIVQGDKDDEVNPEYAKKAVKYFPNAKLHIIKGAGHNAGVDGDFSEWYLDIMDFFKSK
jgi:pimeloyl-ACP methyl ester carboxylesterase